MSFRVNDNIPIPCDGRVFCMNVVCRKGDVFSAEEVCIGLDDFFCIECQRTVCIRCTGRGDSAPECSAADNAVCTEHGIRAADDLPVVTERTGGNRNPTAAVDGTAVFCMFGTNGCRFVRIEVAGGLQVAVDIKGDCLCAGDLSREVDAKPLFRSDEYDAVGIHAADCRKVEGIGGRVAVRRDGRDFSVRIADGVRTCDNLCVLRPEPRVDLNRPCVELGGIHAFCVQTVPGDADVAVLHAQCREISRRIHLCASSCEGDSCRIQKAGTVRQNPVRIGDDDAGPVSCDLQKSAQFGRVRACNFVDDNLCRAVHQVRVSLNVARKLRIGEMIAVVQDRAAFGHVKEVVEVHGDAARRGRCDPDKRNAVCRLKNLRLLSDGGGGVREDLGSKGQ